MGSPRPSLSQCYQSKRASLSSNARNPSAESYRILHILHMLLFPNLQLWMSHNLSLSRMFPAETSNESSKSIGLLELHLIPHILLHSSQICKPLVSPKSPPLQPVQSKLETDPTDPPTALYVVDLRAQPSYIIALDQKRDRIQQQLSLSLSLMRTHHFKLDRPTTECVFSIDDDNPTLVRLAGLESILLQTRRRPKDGWMDRWIQAALSLRRLTYLECNYSSTK